jgi:transcriptional regulator with XRE-family HTH domain
MNTTIFAKRLREARKAANLTQSELCKMSGVTAATISAYESFDGNKGKNPSLDNALKLAQALNVSLDWLCGSLISNSKVQITDFLKMLVQLNEDGFCVPADTINLFEKNVREVLPNAHKSITEDEYYLEHCYCEANGIKDAFTAATVTFTNRYIEKFLNEWQKMKTLYRNGTIDESLYKLWLDKQYKDIDEAQRKDEQKTVEENKEIIITEHSKSTNAKQGGD